MGMTSVELSSSHVIEYNTCGCYTLFSLQIFLETVVIEFCGSRSRAAGLSLSGGFGVGGGSSLLSCNFERSFTQHNAAR